MAKSGRRLGRGAVAFAGLCIPLLAGCSDGTDFELHAPLLDAAGLKLVTNDSKKADDLTERAPLVLPPTSDLPVPGQSQAAQAAEARLPRDPDQVKKDAEKRKKAEKEKYCREGDWSGKGGIGEFDKAVGRDHRCASKLGEALNRTFSNTSASEEAESGAVRR